METSPRPRAADPVPILLGVVAVALAARFDVPVPGSPVPQSLQTLAVVLVGAVLGPWRGAAALSLYLVVGVAGLPVFADGAAGVESLLGPTGGYLVGFVTGAALMGAVVARRDAAGGAGASALGAFGLRGVGRVFAVAMFGAVATHVVILGFGWARLAVLLGAGPAFEGGVLPFLWGGLVKSGVAAGVWTTAAAGRAGSVGRRRR